MHRPIATLTPASATDPGAGQVQWQFSYSDLSFADVTALLQARLAGRPTRASFRTGTLTVCTLVPMRSVPHPLSTKKLLWLMTVRAMAPVIFCGLKLDH